MDTPAQAIEGLREGTRIEIEPTYKPRTLVRQEGQVRLIAFEGGSEPATVDLDTAVLPDLLRLSFETAGQAPPVMLGRPAVDHKRGSEIGPLAVWEQPDGKICIAVATGAPLTAGPGGTRPLAVVTVEPHQVREFAAAAVAHADHADSLRTR